MNKTKTGLKQPTTLPAETMDVLRWHVATQLETLEQEASNLLFPSITGGYRAPCALNKRFDDVATRIELGKRLIQRGLRRSFNDAVGGKNQPLKKKPIPKHWDG